MAKCSICNSRKGKRQCLITGDPICSLCCGSTRNPDLCSECRYYQKPKRKYTDVPAYSTRQMEADLDLQSHANSIEGALCAFDTVNDNRLNDEQAIKIIELLIDKYYFGDQNVETDQQIVEDGFNYVDAAITRDLEHLNNDTIVKILGVIRFVARRRTQTGKEYMNIIHQYVGQRIDTGVRLMRH